MTDDLMRIFMTRSQDLPSTTTALLLEDPVPGKSLSNGWNLSESYTEVITSSGSVSRLFTQLSGAIRAEGYGIK